MTPDEALQRALADPIGALVRLAEGGDKRAVVTLHNMAQRGHKDPRVIPYALLGQGPSRHKLTGRPRGRYANRVAVDQPDPIRPSRWRVHWGPDRDCAWKEWFSYLTALGASEIKRKWLTVGPGETPLPVAAKVFPRVTDTDMRLNVAVLREYARETLGSRGSDATGWVADLLGLTDDTVKTCSRARWSPSRDLGPDTLGGRAHALLLELREDGYQFVRI